MKLPYVRKRFAAGLVGLIGCYVIALNLTQGWVDTASARYEQQASDVQIIMDAFAQDKLLSGPSRALIESFHRKGEVFASQILMATAQTQGDLVRRDKLFLEAISNASNPDAYGLLRQSALYDTEQRDKTMALAEEMKANEGLSKQLVASVTTTLSEPEQQALKSCDQLLHARYNGIFSKVYWFYDLMYRPKSCQMPGPH